MTRIKLTNKSVDSIRELHHIVSGWPTWPVRRIPKKLIEELLERTRTETIALKKEHGGELPVALHRDIGSFLGSLKYQPKKTSKYWMCWRQEINVRACVLQGVLMTELHTIDYYEK